MTCKCTNDMTVEGTLAGNSDRVSSKRNTFKLIGAFEFDELPPELRIEIIEIIEDY